MKKIILFIFAIILLGSLGVSLNTQADGPLEVLQINGTTIHHYGTSDPVMTPQTYVERDSEFRGVWVATVYNLNFPLHSNETQYKAAFDALLDDVEDNNLNAILFQVRPRNDAFYQSAYAPFSRHFTGSEGLDPGWDAMAYMVQAAHDRGIEFHAWMNPYRVTTSAAETLNSLAPNNFARLNPNLVLQDNDGKYILNPGEPEVVDYIENVVSEIMDLYDVDGIHFDDYFYPYSGLPSGEDQDAYNTYKLVGESLSDFRRRSVNNAISGVKSVVDQHNLDDNKDVRFGVSPIGLWKVGEPDGANVASGSSQSYYSQYADSKKWVDEGWVHYINPQIYWNLEHSLAPYADVVDWWAETVRGTDVDLIIGHGIYRTEYPTVEFYEQIKYNQKHPEIKGSMLYSANFLNTTHMNLVTNNLWTTKPLNTWATSSVEAPNISLSGTVDGEVYRTEVEVTLTSAHDIYYHTGDGIWLLYTTPFVVDGQGGHTVYYKAVNSLDEVSLIQANSFEIEKLNLDVPTLTIDGQMINDTYVVGSTVTLSSDENPIWVAINRGYVGEWNLYEGPIILDEADTYFFRVKTIDEEGLDSQIYTQSIEVTLESYPDPIISIDGVGRDPYYQNAEISFTSDAESVSYQINGGGWNTYTEPFTLDTEGTYTITYRNDDATMNEVTKDIIIDQTVPLDPTVTITGEQEDNYYIEETTVDLASANGTDEIYYRLHNGKSWSNWTLYSETLILGLNATYTLEYYAQDEALNVTETLSERIRLNIPPSETNLFVVRDGDYVNYYQTDTPVELPTTYTEKDAEVRAVWVATVSNIDFGMHYSEESYKNEIITMLDRLEELNFNVMFFQTRPMNDAFYESDYAPWSRYIMGAEGIDPGWDIFQFILDEAHQRGIEVHAWLNPYRVSTGTADKQTQLDALHDDNFAKQNPDLVIQDSQGKLILNPGEPRVRAYIINVVNELMSKYDVDGIHFDDYFYSYSGMSDAQDAETYNRTKLTGESLDDWRRRNVDTLIENLHITIGNWNRNRNETVEFGISPFGIWSSGGEFGSNTSPYALQSYSDQYADTRKWVMEGWLDYIMPQLYWEFDHSAAPFADLVDWWAELTEAHGVDLIIGHGFYRYAENTWDNPNEITEQLRYISQYDSIVGSSFFSYKTLNSLNSNVVQALERIGEHYWTKYATFPWESDVTKVISVPTIEVDGDMVVENVYENSATISFTSEHDVYYKIGAGDWTLFNGDFFITETGNYIISYKAVDEDGIESTIEDVYLEIIDQIDPPTLDIEGSLLSGNKYEDSVTLTLTASDIIYYKINNGSWLLYNRAIVIDDPGTYTVTFKAVGEHGNESGLSTVTLEIISTSCDDGYEYKNGECVIIEVPEPKTGCGSALSTTSALVMTLGLIIASGGIFYFRRRTTRK
jgi:uncharacterized lipoprotein YddW (UPF0748 family)